MENDALSPAIVHWFREVARFPIPREKLAEWGVQCMDDLALMECPREFQLMIDSCEPKPKLMEQRRLLNAAKFLKLPGTPPTRDT